MPLISRNRTRKKHTFCKRNLLRDAKSPLGFQGQGA